MNFTGDVVHVLLRGDSGCFGLLLDLLTVLVGAGLEIDIKAGHTLIAGNGVRQNDFIGIADMGLGRRIGNGCGYIIRFLFHGKFLLYRNAYLLPIILNYPP